jgi:hypothetical protein
MSSNPEHAHYRHRCVDCGALSPETETNYTLISSQHGWRLSRASDPLGNPVMEWRCPRCWARHKGLMHSDPAASKRGRFA